MGQNCRRLLLTRRRLTVYFCFRGIGQSPSYPPGRGIRTDGVDNDYTTLPGGRRHEYGGPLSHQAGQGGRAPGAERNWERAAAVNRAILELHPEDGEAANRLARR